MNKLARLAAAGLLGFGGLIAGCSSSRSIEALPPSPAVAADTSTASNGSLGRVDVRFAIAGAPLPDEIQRLQLRIDEVLLHRKQGTWLTLPSASGLFEVTRDDDDVERSILNTQIPPGAYDSVSVTLADVYVQYGSNAGGPLIQGKPPKTTRAMQLRVDEGQVTTLPLVLNPGASLTRTRNCSWIFAPFLDADGATR